MFRYKTRPTSRWDFSTWTGDDLADLIKHAKRALTNKENVELFERRKNWNCGDRVWARDSKQKIFFGTIARINVRTVLVHFDDGDRIKLSPLCLRWHSRPEKNSNVVSFSQMRRKKTEPRAEVF